MAHVHSTLGVRAKDVFSPPVGSSDSYLDLLSFVNPSLNALFNYRIPLEFVHYVVKLADNYPIQLAYIRDLIGDPDAYNSSSLQESGEVS